MRRVLALPQPQRSTVLLRYFEGLEPSRIARRQGVPAGTVRSRLKRGLDSLRADLDRECGGDRQAWVAALLPWAGTAPTAGTAGSAGILGALATTAKTKAILAILGVLLAGGLLGWHLLRGPAGGDEETTRAARTRGGPILRGARGAAAATPVAAAEEAAAPDDVARVGEAAATRVALAFVDEDGRPWTVPELQGLYAAAGLAPRVTFVCEAQLEHGGLPGLVATLFGPADAWQETADLAWTQAGATAAPSEAGDWRVFLSRPGAAPYLSDPRALAAGRLAALEIPLPRHPRRVTVRVLGARTGRPLEGATLTPWYEVGDDQAFLRGASVTADGAGEATLAVSDDGLPGRARGATWWIETATHARMLSNLVLRQHDDQRVLTWRVHPTATVTGRAWTAGGEPAAGCEVVHARKGRARRTTVAEDGTYTLTGIPLQDAPERSESLLLLEDPARGVVTGAKATVRAGETTPVDLGRPATPSAAALAGRITAGERPLQGVFVSAKTLGAPGKGRMVLTDADGRYHLAGLDEGANEVRIYFGDPRVVDDFRAWTPSEGLVLAAGTETRLDLALPEGAILLTLVDDDDQPVAGGVGLVPGEEHVLVAGGDRYGKVTRQGVLPGTWADPVRLTVPLRPPRSR